MNIGQRTVIQKHSLPQNSRKQFCSCNSASTDNWQKTQNILHSRGEHSEALVVEYFSSQNYVLKARRWKTPFAEIDLLFHHEEEGWLMVEVKTLDNFDPLDMLSNTQLQRLRRAAEFVLSRLREMPSLMLAAVNHLGQIQVLPLK